MLSKPKLESSAGRKSSASSSTASRSRTALRYSVRFRRWNVADRPGSRVAAQLASSSPSSQSRKPSRAAASGRGRPAGGITPPRSLRTTRSHSAAWPPTSARSRVSRVSPTARSCPTSGDAGRPSPFTVPSLWQVTQ